MSSFRQQETVITDERALIKSLEDKGYKPVVSESKTSVRGHYNETGKAEIILKKEDLGQGGDIGFSKGKDGTFSIVVDTYVMQNKGWNLKKFTKEVSSAYTETHIAQELRKKGFIVKRRVPKATGGTQLIYGRV